MTRWARPLPLSLVLAAGDDPRTILAHRWQHFLDYIVEAAPLSEEARLDTAERDERSLESALSGGEFAAELSRLTDHPDEYLTILAWEAELVRDPRVLDELLEQLTPAERLEYDLRVDAWLAPHPLAVVAAHEWTFGVEARRCAGCGGKLAPDDPVLTIDHHEEHSEEPDCGPWCRLCVLGAAQAMTAALEELADLDAENRPPA